MVDQPVKLWAGDFDTKANLDPVLDDAGISTQSTRASLFSPTQASRPASASAIRICTPSRLILAHQQPVYVVNGTVVTDSVLRKLPADRIASMQIEQPKTAAERAQARQHYGPNASNGLIFVTLK